MKKLFFILIVLLGVASTAFNYNTMEFRTLPVTADGPTIAVWNAQTLGQAKMQNLTERESVIQVASSFDFTVLQEVRDASGDTTVQLQSSLHPDFAVRETERRGRTSYKESMILVWNTSVFSLSDGYHIADPEDIYEREPYVTNVTYQNDTFTVVTAHLQPSAVRTELPQLKEDVTALNTSFLLLGDLNADCSYYDEDDVETYTWVVPDSADTTTGQSDCTYDRIITNSDRFKGHTVHTGVTTSDHYPVSTVYDNTVKPQS